MAGDNRTIIYWLWDTKPARWIGMSLGLIGGVKMYSEMVYFERAHYAHVVTWQEHVRVRTMLDRGRSYLVSRTPRRLAGAPSSVQLPTVAR